MLTDEETREFLRLRGLHDADLLERWRCGVQGHSGCFTADHISEETMLAEADAHATTCQCWRHGVIRELDRLRRLEQMTKPVTAENHKKGAMLTECSEHLAREYHEQASRLGEAIGVLAPYKWDDLSPDQQRLAVVTMRSLLYRGVIVCTKIPHRIKFSLRERV